MHSDLRSWVDISFKRGSVGLGRSNSRCPLKVSRQFFAAVINESGRDVIILEISRHCLRLRYNMLLNHLYRGVINNRKGSQVCLRFLCLRLRYVMLQRWG